MELTAVIEALAALKRPSRVIAAHRFAVRAEGDHGVDPRLEGDAAGAPPRRQPVKNVDLWKRLDELAAQHHVDWGG